MSDPGELAPYFGFTEDEVKYLCKEYDMDFIETKDWYDGYTLYFFRKYPPIPIYSPKSVVESMLRSDFGTYWNQTETYEALLIYLRLNFYGLKDVVISMLAGDSVEIDMRGFQKTCLYPEQRSTGRMDYVCEACRRMGWDRECKKGP